MSASLLSLYQRVTRWPCGHWLFSRAVCLRAPYFATIAPLFIALEPGRCEVRMRDRWRVHNHIGSVHAIALCNLAELSAGVMAEATLPAGARWIPKGMSVEYLSLAKGSMHAVATPEAPLGTIDGGREWPVCVAVTDPSGAPVFRARVTLWVSPRKSR
ncbi:MAG TPA: hotdog fold domain-containing protein [Dyella sp.]|uniref:hotdog fold domain-containing protein n=1 Tax=Dyella sp. TaxID=1869338 RepID=UPI002C418DAC|nr:hotdog fold domain-containing protein [Dyella sp.]HUB88304.1 hotdog fold domain-containing protein [Dyella sp.]